MQERLDRQTLQDLREQLESRRKELVSRREAEARRREQLGARESEPEERAQAETGAALLHSMDEESRQEIWEIDAALTRMDMGNYGLCSGCGGDITTKRLQAVPWTRYCLDCADKGLQQTRAELAPEDVETPGTLPSGTPASLPEVFQGLDGEQFRQALLERLGRDDRLALTEVRPRLEEGRLVLEGAVASEADRQMLLQVLHDRLGFGEVDDRLVADPLLHARGQSPETAPENVPRTEEQELLEGESGGEDLQRAVDEGGSIIPPDRFQDPRER